MKYKIRIALLALSVLFLVPGGQQASTGSATNQFESLASPPLQPASMTVPANTDAVVVKSDASPNSRGWSPRGSNASLTGGQDIASDVLAAYSLAVAVSPPECQLTMSLLAAIGQVESGNLAGHKLDAGHRVVPAILGPVLDGAPFAAVEDTDGGQWDGDRAWDRAMGPLQLIPSSWRVVSVDMDGDGVRDPQDIYDAAGAAMLYLCAGGRDLGTEAGVKDAVLSYNHSAAYVKLVLAWKAVYDRTDLTSSDAPVFAAWATPPTAAPETSPASRTPHSPRATANPRPTAAVKARTSPTSSTTPTSPTSPTTTQPAASTPATPTSSGTP
ncbi:MAG TPA: lytic murein transglycosylase, partial [Nocardioidaceae bacterium]|nr:lytic murein transglycosylase [Nocardioidaceae bacterium]